MFCKIKKSSIRDWLIVGGFLLCVYFVTLGSGRYGEPKLELSLQKFDPDTQDILVRLVVTNVGNFRLCIPRLREEMLENHMVWGGWLPFIKEKHRAGVFAGPWWKRYRFTVHDLITLAPGEHFDVLINLARMERFPYHNGPPPALVTENGEYEARVRLLLGTNSTGESNIPFFLFWKVWEGDVESNTITFVIDHEIQEQSSQEEKQGSQQ